MPLANRQRLFFYAAEWVADQRIRNPTINIFASV